MTLVQIRMFPLLAVLVPPRLSWPSTSCLPCRWGWPVMMCASGRWHHATGSRVPGEVTPCTHEPVVVVAAKPLLRITAPGFVAGIEVGGRCAPILRRLQGRDDRWRAIGIDMARWTEDQIRAFCARRRWTVEACS